MNINFTGLTLNPRTISGYNTVASTENIQHWNRVSFILPDHLEISKSIAYLCSWCDDNIQGEYDCYHNTRINKDNKTILGFMVTRISFYFKNADDAVFFKISDPVEIIKDNAIPF